VPEPGESAKPVAEAVYDAFRQQFYARYIAGVCRAVAEDGANVTGYYAWSLMDNFEVSVCACVCVRVCVCVCACARWDADHVAGHTCDLGRHTTAACVRRAHQQPRR
jgi:hypothetical protein